MLGSILRRAKGASAASTRASSTRIAVVGSGPSGFYSAKYLLKELPSAHVDVLDALPNPYGAFPRCCALASTPRLLPSPSLFAAATHLAPLLGLVRSGVAPDHLEVK